MSRKARRGALRLANSPSGSLPATPTVGALRKSVTSKLDSPGGSWTLSPLSVGRPRARLIYSQAKQVLQEMRDELPAEGKLRALDIVKAVYLGTIRVKKLGPISHFLSGRDVEQAQPSPVKVAPVAESETAIVASAPAEEAIIPVVAERRLESAGSDLTAQSEEWDQEDEAPPLPALLELDEANFQESMAELALLAQPNAAMWEDPKLKETLNAVAENLRSYEAKLAALRGRAERNQEEFAEISSVLKAASSRARLLLIHAREQDPSIQVPDELQDSPTAVSGEPQAVAADPLESSKALWASILAAAKALPVLPEVREAPAALPEVALLMSSQEEKPEEIVLPLAEDEDVTPPVDEVPTSPEASVPEVVAPDVAPPEVAEDPPAENEEPPSISISSVEVEDAPPVDRQEDPTPMLPVKSVNTVMLDPGAPLVPFRSFRERRLLLRSNASCKRVKSDNSSRFRPSRNSLEVEQEAEQEAEAEAEAEPGPEPLPEGQVDGLTNAALENESMDAKDQEMPRPMTRQPSTRDVEGSRSICRSLLSSSSSFVSEAEVPATAPEPDLPGAINEGPASAGTDSAVAERLSSACSSMPSLARAVSEDERNKRGWGSVTVLLDREAAYPRAQWPPFGTELFVSRRGVVSEEGLLDCIARSLGWQRQSRSASSSSTSNSLYDRQEFKDSRACENISGWASCWLEAAEDEKRWQTILDLSDMPDSIESVMAARRQRPFKIRTPRPRVGSSCSSNSAAPALARARPDNPRAAVQHGWSSREATPSAAVWNSLELRARPRKVAPLRQTSRYRTAPLQTGLLHT